MSPPDDPGADGLSPADRDDLLAAEYVLGVLALDERRAAARRAEVDGAFAARVQAWESRLAPLDAATPAVPVADLLPAIEARLFPARPRPARVRRWLIGSALAASVMGALVLSAGLWPRPPAPLQTTLAAEGLVFEARLEGAVLQIDRQGPAAGPSADYQLWAIGEDGVPRSLGLLRGDRVRLPVRVPAGVTLAVSLEPLGGAPGALPTGPVLAAAVLD